ncbi:hypothetical protein LTR37_008387 [Vermiconidia calcicola]|uniref:Uncharacterized protein n=1 Tax=Vermiconidia calcicola TaxID=1690605 RepID=A0ACC3NBB1_9PEZI|nr:hypothetical protein LTR37_008387 [Vermiconidia calcicola]
MSDNNRDNIEQPGPLPPTTNSSGETIKQRTEQQQQKSDLALKQQQRESGEQSNRSRSQSRRDRRKRVSKAQEDGKYMKTNSLEALEEADANMENMAMQPFERIGPDSTSMEGPVTMARAKRGEIPVRGGNPNEPYYMTPEKAEKGVLESMLELGLISLPLQSDLKNQDGLKLTLEANLEIEIELKASIRGDITISL